MGPIAPKLLDPVDKLRPLPNWPGFPETPTSYDVAPVIVDTTYAPTEKTHEFAGIGVGAVTEAPVSVTNVSRIPNCRLAP